jgi:hypothetical protein
MGGRTNETVPQCWVKLLTRQLLNRLLISAGESSALPAIIATTFPPGFASVNVEMLKVEVRNTESSNRCVLPL